MFSRLWICTAALSILTTSSFGQRVFTTVKPSAVEQNLKFDVNTLPVSSDVTNDLNFSPNVVFSEDSSKAFVSYTGSDAVLVFRPHTGEILSVLKIEKNPSLLTVTPDGKRIVTSCLFLKDNAPQRDNLLGKQIGAVAIIDIATLEVKIVSLTKVQFSFANNIVVSQDSKTAFIASFTTDEILRIDLEAGAEITPRLKLTPGHRPASLAMAADFSYFTVVLVGSSYLDRRQTPDSVQTVDPGTFTVKATVNTQVKADELPYNFNPVNTVALSKDGKTGAIADQAASTISSTPLVEDRVILFDPSSGEIRKVINVGYAAGETTLSPDGKLFILVTELEVVAINIESGEVARVIPVLADFKPTNRPTFSKDSKWMFLSLPLSDKVLVFNMVTGEIARAFDVGTLVQPPLPDDDPNKGLAAAPLSLAWTPDGQVLTCVNFNAATVDLIKDTDVFGLPLFFYNEKWYTGFALLNNADAEANVLCTAYSKFGIQYVDLNDTTDVVEYVNPKTLKLAPGQQLAYTAAQLLEMAPGQTIDGWLDVDSNLFKTTSFYLTGDSAFKRMDGGLPTMTMARTVLVPEVRVTDGFWTEIFVQNPTYTIGDIVLKLYDQNGNLVSQLPSLQVAQLGVYTGLVRDPDGAALDYNGIFADEAFTNFENGYLVVESPRGVAAVERYYDPERMSILPAWPVGPEFNTETKFLIPQGVAFGGSDSFINLINTGAETASVTLTMRGNLGELLGTPMTVQIEPRKQYRKNIVDVFGLADAGEPISGWIAVESDRAGLVGDAEIRVFSGKAMTSLPLLSLLAKTLVFSHVSQGQGFAAGLAIVNSGLETANLRLEVHEASGAKTHEREFSLRSGERLIGLLKDFFPDLPDMVGGYLKIVSDRELGAVEMFFSDDLEMLSTVPAQSLN
jgi:sugar lactone lactonase YvrE